MRVGKEQRRWARTMLKACLKEGGLDPATVRDLVAKVASEKPRGYMAILTEFARLVRLYEQNSRAVVVSAKSLLPGEPDHIAAEIRKKFGLHIFTEFSVDPALIGGLRIAVGSDVYDGSIRGHLAQLASTF